MLRIAEFKENIVYCIGVRKIELYNVVISVLCKYYDFTEDEVELLLKDRERRYLLVLFLNEYRCLNKEKLIEELKFKSTRSIDCTLRRAEEKLLISKEFRTSYLYIDKKIQKKY